MILIYKNFAIIYSFKIDNKKVDEMQYTEYLFIYTFWIKYTKLSNTIILYNILINGYI